MFVLVRSYVICLYISATSNHGTWYYLPHGAASMSQQPRDCLPWLAKSGLGRNLIGSTEMTATTATHCGVCRASLRHVALLGRPLHPIHLQTSRPCLATGYRWTRTREWGQCRATLHNFNQSHSASHFFIPPFSLSSPSPVAMGKRQSDRCGYTGSRSRKPAHRRPRPFLVALIGTAVEFGSRLGDWAALSRTALLTPVAWGRG